jgi:uncharacterized integral membrane protein (TIGR00697 family)
VRVALDPARAEELDDYQLCYWYCLEIEARADEYRRRAPSDVRVHRVELAELREPEGIERLGEALELGPLSAFGHLQLRALAGRRLNAKDAQKARAREHRRRPGEARGRGGRLGSTQRAPHELAQAMTVTTTRGVPVLESGTGRQQNFRYYDLVMATFVVVLLASNLIGPAKSCSIELPFSLPWLGNKLTFGAGNIFFPIAYIFDDVLTEVYGYARARRAIWTGFGALVFVSLMSFVIIKLPGNPDEPYNAVLQPALETVFGNTWRIVVASLVAFWVGDFINSYVLARMKVWTAGRRLWARTIGSTVVGEAADSVIFYPIAFYGVWTANTLIAVMVFNWFVKVAVEVLMTPCTYWIVAKLKRAENEDFFDTHTNFTPFSLKDE